MHPAIQQLIDVKWNLFGKRSCVLNVLANVFYAVLWSVLGLMTPRSDEKYYLPLRANWWRIVLEFIGVIMTIYFMVTVS